MGRVLGNGQKNVNGAFGEISLFACRKGSDTETQDSSKVSVCSNFFSTVVNSSTVKFVFCRTVRGYHNFKRAT